MTTLNIITKKNTYWILVCSGFLKNHYDLFSFYVWTEYWWYSRHFPWRGFEILEKYFLYKKFTEMLRKKGYQIWYQMKIWYFWIILKKLKSKWAQSKQKRIKSFILDSSVIIEQIYNVLINLCKYLFKFSLWLENLPWNIFKMNFLN